MTVLSGISFMTFNPYLTKEQAEERIASPLNVAVPTIRLQDIFRPSDKKLAEAIHNNGKKND